MSETSEPDKIAHQLPAGYFENGDMAVIYDFSKSPPSSSGRIRILCYQTPDMGSFRHFERDVCTLGHEAVHDIVPGTPELVERYVALQRHLLENDLTYAGVHWDFLRLALQRMYEDYLIGNQRGEDMSGVIVDGIA